MTNKEAIDFFAVKLEKYKSRLSRSESKQNCLDEEKTSLKRKIGAMTLALEALDKQIPREYLHGSYFPLCPKCGGYIGSPPDNMHKCCTMCGQRIAWGQWEVHEHDE